MSEKGMLDDCYRYYPSLTIIVLFAWIGAMMFGVGSLLYFGTQYMFENSIINKYGFEKFWCFKTGGVEVNFIDNIGFHGHVCSDLNVSWEKKLADYWGYDYWDHFWLFDNGIKHIEGKNHA